MAMLRYPRFRYRPGHADALHLDLWLGDRNILRDGGTYSYNAERKWLNYFSVLKAIIQCNLTISTKCQDWAGFCLEIGLRLRALKAFGRKAEQPIFELGTPAAKESGITGKSLFSQFPDGRR